LWFMAGFGNLELLKKSNFSPIDSPTIDAFISLIVQGFFAYRIWTLNKRALWLCLLIVVVSDPSTSKRIQLLPILDFLHSMKLSIVQAIGAAWGGIKVSLVLIKIPTLCLTWDSGNDTRDLCSRSCGSICMHSPSLLCCISSAGLLIVCPIALVDYQCSGRCFDRRGYDVPGM
jgi:hypothetical protein